MKKNNSPKKLVNNSKSPMITPVRVALVGILVTLVVLVIKTNIENSKSTNRVVIPTVRQTQSQGTVKDNIESLKNVEFEIADIIKGNLPQKELFAVSEILPEDMIINKSRDNFLYFLINNNLLINKGQYATITNIEEINSVFYVRFEYGKPEIDKVIGEKVEKVEKVLLFPLNRLHEGANKFVFTDKGTNTVVSTLEYSFNGNEAEKRSCKIINPSVSPSGKKIAYMSNKEFSWNLYIYDTETKETVVGKNPEYFNDITDQNDNMYSFDNFPEYTWSSDNELIVTNTHEIYKLNTLTGVNAFITSDDKNSQEVNVQYDESSKGLYYVETYNLESATIMQIKTDRSGKRMVVNDSEGVIRNMSVSPDGLNIAYTIFNTTSKGYKYKLKVHNKVDNKTIELYQGNKIEDICWKDNENVIFTNSLTVGSSVNNIYSIKSNKTNFKQLTKTEDKYYHKFKVVNSEVFFLTKSDLYGTLWSINGDDIKKVIDDKIVGDYDVFEMLNELMFTGEDYSLYRYNVSNKVKTKIVSSVIEKGGSQSE